MQLAEDELSILKDVIGRHLDALPNKAFVFGSRATGTARKFSDIDIGIVGPRLDSEKYFSILDDLEKSPLEYLVDLVQFEDVSDSFKSIAQQKIIPLN